MPAADTASVATVRAILADLQTAPNRTLGQNFLINAAVLDRIVRTADVSKEDAVLEIGPGLGALTMRLAQAAKQVTAIEKDAVLARWLACQSWATDSHTRIISGDALEVNWEETTLPASQVKIVANLPYSVSKPLLRRIYEEWRPHLHSATVMVQKEVALRLTARAGDGDWGPMGIMAQLYSTTKRCFDIAPGSFWPAPEVTSSIVHVQLHEQPHHALADENLFWKIVRAAFSMRRKQLLNSLLPLVGDKMALVALLESCAVDPKRRPQTVSTAEFVALTKAFLQRSSTSSLPASE